MSDTALYETTTKITNKKSCLFGLSDNIYKLQRFQYKNYVEHKYSFKECNTYCIIGYKTIRISQ